MLNMMGEITGKVGEVTNMVGEINSRVGDVTQTVNLHSQSIAKLEAQVGQIANTLTRGKKGSFQVS